MYRNTHTLRLNIVTVKGSEYLDFARCVFYASHYVACLRTNSHPYARSCNAFLLWHRCWCVVTLNNAGTYACNGFEQVTATCA